MENIKFETMLLETTKLPMVKIDRESFLRKELQNRYTKEIVEKAIQYNPAYAGICVEDINKIAKSCITAETMNLLTLFIGVMFGVNGAVGTINKLAVQVAKQIAKKLPQKALTKGMIYPIVKKIATLLGIKMTKQIFAGGVAKVIPILGAFISGGMTFISFKSMSEKLRKYLETTKLASVEYYKKMSLETIIVEETTDI